MGFGFDTKKMKEAALAAKSGNIQGALKTATAAVNQPAATPTAGATPPNGAAQHAAPSHYPAADPAYPSAYPSAPAPGYPPAASAPAGYPEAQTYHMPPNEAPQPHGQAGYPGEVPAAPPSAGAPPPAGADKVGEQMKGLNLEKVDAKHGLRAMQAMQHGNYAGAAREAAAAIKPAKPQKLNPDGTPKQGKVDSKTKHDVLNFAKQVKRGNMFGAAETAIDLKSDHGRMQQQKEVTQPQGPLPVPTAGPGYPPNPPATHY